MNDLHIQQYPLERLIPYARNARTHADEQISQIAGSIAEFGFINPILVGEDNVIIAGHGRLMAAQRLGLKTVPVIMLAHLSETQRQASPDALPKWSRKKDLKKDLDDEIPF
jgi:ParB-like chromosome segregation protein Spo0J